MAKRGERGVGCIPYFVEDCRLLRRHLSLTLSGVVCDIKKTHLDSRKHTSSITSYFDRELPAD